MPFLAVWLPVLIGCGAAPITTEFSASISWAQSPLDCADDAAALAELSAELWIGGYTEKPCALQVDANSHSVSGTCPDIKPEFVRPLMLHYFIPNSAGGNHSLLFCFSYVDLRSESLPADVSGDIDVTLCDGTGSPMIYEESVMMDLPAWDSDEADPVEKARMWTRLTYYDNDNFDGVLDSDADGCPNLVEVCNDTLDEAGNTDC